MRSKLFLILLFAIFIGCEKDDEDTLVVTACFEYYPNELRDGKIQFENCSINAKKYLWDFGDGETSTEKNPLHVYDENILHNVTLIAYNGSKSDTISEYVFDDIMVKKPNIYIYPLKDMSLCLSLEFPMGGNIVESIPSYNDGWCFNVDNKGLIDNKYNYLFYESKQPDIFQSEKGWCIAKSDLKSFFEMNMSDYNFSIQEINDFTDYWIPLLNDNSYYYIFPQTNEIIDRIIRFNFSVKPDNIYRLFYGIVGSENFIEIKEPEIIPFVRSGFYVVEWGVFTK